ncbi:MAG: phosphatase PAP2 family protein [Planctomycetaceae bacterium]|nr:phosphatase PAP2 family protein [Planctomycetaceae bacterium]
MNQSIYLSCLKFVAVVLGGIVLIFVCNRFLDYPVSYWFCKGKFNIVEHPRWRDVDDAAGKNDKVVDIANIDNIDKSGEKLQRRLTGCILLLEFFGHPLCFFTVLSVCFLLDVSKRNRLWAFVFSVLASQSVVTAVKFLIHRKRPVINDFTMSSFDFSGFVGREEVNSFPSGHTALAVVMALVIARNYPRGRYFFYLAVLGVAFERVFDCRHYLSDTVTGGLIAYVVYFFCYELGFIAKVSKMIGLPATDSDTPNEMQNERIDNKHPTVLFNKMSSGKHLGSGIHQFLRANDKLIDLNSQQPSAANAVEPIPTPDQPAQTSDQNLAPTTLTQQKLKHNNRKNNLPFDNFKKF